MNYLKSLMVEELPKIKSFVVVGVKGILNNRTVPRTMLESFSCDCSNIIIVIIYDDDDDAIGTRCCCVLRSTV